MPQSFPGEGSDISTCKDRDWESLGYWKTDFIIQGFHLILHFTELPMTHSLRVFDALEPKFIPFKFVLCVELTLWFGEWGVCLLSESLYYASGWKSGNSFPLVRHRYHSCDLGSGAMLSAQLYTLGFQACDHLVLKNYQISVMKKNWRLTIKKGSFTNVTVKAWSWKFK